MAKKTIQFEIATPERIVLKQKVTQITIPTTSGEITVLPEHMPIISVLKPGVLETKNEKEEIEIISVSGGFVEIMPNRVVILADTAERAEEIDEKRVQEAKERAEETKKKIRTEDRVEFTEISAKLEKELARLRAVDKWRKLKK